MEKNKKEAIKILFVCLGNICRSPASENVFKHIVNENKCSDRFFLDSAGTCSYHVGEAPNSSMTTVLKKRGISNKGQARQLKSQDLSNFDHIYYMDDSNYYNIKALKDFKTNKEKVEKLSDFCKDHQTDEVPDPYFGNSKGFEYCADIIQDACSQLFSQLKDIYKL